MHSMGLIVPYRNRRTYLEKFAPYITEYLNNSKIDFKLYVIEQDNLQNFNKGILLNIGFSIAQHNHDYFVFHNVDMLPHDIDYSYNILPSYFDGITLFTKENFIKINGFNNKCWDSINEDLNLLLRCKKANLDVQRRKTGFFDYLSSEVDENREENLFKNLENELNKSNLIEFDSGLSNLNYDIIHIQDKKNYMVYSVKF